jgi:hypothetical protein
MRIVWQSNWKTAAAVAAMIATLALPGMAAGIKEGMRGHDHPDTANEPRGREPLIATSTSEVMADYLVLLQHRQISGRFMS